MGADRRLLVLKLAVSIALLTYLLSRSNLSSVGAVLAGLTPWMLLPILALYFFNTLISAYKWSILLAADGFVITYPALVRSYLIGTFFNLFLPSSIGGDAYRIYDVSKRSSRTAESLASVFADRFTGFLALAFWGLLFSLVGASLIPDRRILFVPLVFFLLLFLAVFALFKWGRTALALLRMDRLPGTARFVGKILDSADAYRSRRGVVVAAMGLSLLFQFLVIFLVHLMGRMLRIEAPFLLYCMFVPLITLIEALPVSIYGMGVRDMSYVFFFTQVGIPREQALSLSLVFLAVSIVYAFTLGGLAFLTRGARRPVPLRGNAP